MPLSAPSWLVSEEFILDQLDAERFINDTLVDNTCEWCDQTFLPEREEGKVEKVVTRVWRTRREARNGYTISHKRCWRVCRQCLHKTENWFSSWVFPVIKAITPCQNLVEQLLTVQPMAQPRANVFYMDYRIGPEDAEVLHENPVRGQRANALMLDDANMRLDPQHNDAVDAVLLAAWAYQNYPGQPLR